MEEQRQRHEDETQKAQLESLNESLTKPPAATGTTVSMDTNESGLARVEETALPVSCVVQVANCIQSSLHSLRLKVMEHRYNCGILVYATQVFYCEGVL